jgi:hypothetical protein
VLAVVSSLPWASERTFSKSLWLYPELGRSLARERQEHRHVHDIGVVGVLSTRGSRLMWESGSENHLQYPSDAGDGPDVGGRSRSLTTLHS